MVGINRFYGLMPSTKSHTQPNHTVQVNRMGGRQGKYARNQDPFGPSACWRKCGETVWVSQAGNLGPQLVRALQADHFTTAGYDSGMMIAEIGRIGSILCELKRSELCRNRLWGRTLSCDECETRSTKQISLQSWLRDSKFAPRSRRIFCRRHGMYSYTGDPRLYSPKSDRWKNRAIV